MTLYERITKREARTAVTNGDTVLLTTPSQTPDDGYALSTAGEQALATHAGGEPCTFDEVVDSFEDQVGRVVYYIVKESN